MDDKSKQPWRGRTLEEEEKERLDKRKIGQEDIVRVDVKQKIEKRRRREGWKRKNDKSENTSRGRILEEREEKDNKRVQHWYTKKEMDKNEETKRRQRGMDKKKCEEGEY